MLPRRVVAWIVAVAGVAACSTTRRDAEMLPSRETNFAVGVPFAMLRKPRRLPSRRYATTVCKIEEPEDVAANGSSSQEPGDNHIMC
jgi:hypothetical protein